MDWFTFIHYFYQYGEYGEEDEGDTDLFTIIDENLLKDNGHPDGTLAWHGRPCTWTSENGPCTRFELDEKFILQTPFQYLQACKQGSEDGTIVYTLPRVALYASLAG
jgi:hypothetical protein